jgi:uncharacterized protein YjbI with pentapeptide repeats
MVWDPRPAAEDYYYRWRDRRGLRLLISAVIILTTMLLGILLVVLGRPIGYVFSAISVALILILIGYRVQWTGFGAVPIRRTDGPEIQPMKLLWDWLQLMSALAVPVVIAVAGFWFTTNQNAQQDKLENKRIAEAQKLADQRAQVDREIEEQRAQDEALQAYLDQMSQLLLDKKLLRSEESSPVRTLAQARTTTIISRLDAEDNVSVTRFLTDSGLTGARRANLEQPSTVSLLRQTALRDADLAGAFLPDADLTEANLPDADLSNASLVSADLSGANLEGTKLKGADLIFADLTNADLRDANLTDANLDKVKWKGTELEGATLPSSSSKFVEQLIDLIQRGDSLEGANLVGADLAQRNLAGASLQDADLSKASLSGANLEDANLAEADLFSADLSGTNLEGASLEGANLEDTNLEDAALSNTNLREANVTQKQLDQAGSLEGATMPDGQVLKGPDSPNGPTFEEWRKSREGQG